MSRLFKEVELKKIRLKGVYLFGSVARGDFGPKSDVDLFFDIDKHDQTLFRRLLLKSLKRFYSSDEYQKFKLIGIKNAISPKIGLLEEWELKESIKKEGLVLYSGSFGKGLEKYFIIQTEPIKDIANRNRVMRTLTGRREKAYRGRGLIEEFDGRVLNPRIYVVNSKYWTKIVKFLSKEKVKYSLLEIWM